LPLGSNRGNFKPLSGDLAFTLLSDVKLALGFTGFVVFSFGILWGSKHNDHWAVR